MGAWWWQKGKKEAGPRKIKLAPTWGTAADLLNLCAGHDPYVAVSKELGGVTWLELAMMVARSQLGRPCAGSPNNTNVHLFGTQPGENGCIICKFGAGLVYSDHKLALHNGFNDSDVHTNIPMEMRQ